MQKSDLRSGMIVELRKGTRFMYMNDYLYNEMHEYNISHYNHTLHHYENIKTLDIVKVYRLDIDNIKNIFKLIKLGDILTDKYLKLIWERKETDWAKVPFATRVKVWDDHEENALEGKFLGYNKGEEGSYPFNVFVNVDYDVAWRKCKLIEESKEEKEVTYEEIKKEFDMHCNENRCGNCKYYKENQCKFIYILDNYKVTRKEK